MSQQSPDTPQNWDAASAGYSEHVAPKMMTPFASEIIVRLQPKPETSALEVACGSGALTLELAKSVGSLLATDFAPKMIERAKTSVEREGLENVRFAVMDGQALDLEVDAVDCAASSFGVMLFPDRTKGFSELNRVVRPGGRVVVSAWAGPQRFEAFGIFLAALQRAFPDMPPSPSPPPVFSLADPQVFKQEMKDAGFKDIQIDFVARELVLEGFDQVWNMVSTGAPPVKMLMDQIGLEGRIKLKDALQSIINERFGGGQVTLTNTATIGVGICI